MIFFFFKGEEDWQGKEGRGGLLHDLVHWVFRTGGEVFRVKMLHFFFFLLQCLAIPKQGPSMTYMGREAWRWKDGR